jgi:hypothetical protein
MTDITTRLSDMSEAMYMDRSQEEVDALLLEAKGEIERLREGLREILDPISYMRARMNVADGEGLNGPMAIALSNNPNYLKEIARAALIPQQKGNADGEQ